MKQHNTFKGTRDWFNDDYDFGYQTFPARPKYKKHLVITTTGVALGEDTSPNIPTIDKGRSSLGAETIELCQKILCYTRASKSRGQDNFALWLENELIKLKLKPNKDAYGNIMVAVKGSKPVETMFTSHIDTCHKPNDPATQTIYYDEVEDVLWKDDNMCLGADDGTGVYIMLHMIRNKIPGLYTFFRDEEIGRVGSQKAASTLTKENMKDIKRCISFDRAGPTDIVRSQSPGICCSDEFVNALSKQLAEINPMFIYKGAQGTYTDSASFMHLVPECTNLSVGYKNQHSGLETQHVGTFLRVLKDYSLVDWDKLPTVRKAEIKTSNVKSLPKGVAPAKKTPPKQSFEDTMEAFLSTIDSDLIELMDLIESSPRLVAYALASDGYTAGDLLDLIDKSSVEVIDMFGEHYDA